MTKEPIYIERACGGWMAISPDDDMFRIGVIGQSHDAVRSAYDQAHAAWERLLDLARAKDAALA